MPDAPARRPVVWVAQHDSRGVNLTGASRFGEIYVLFKDDVYPDTVDEAMPGVLRRATEELRDFNPAQDFLCLSGAPLHLAMCATVLGRLFPEDGVNVLRWDRVEGAYYPIRLMPAIEETIDAE